MSTKKPATERFPPLDMSALKGSQKIMADELLAASKGYVGGPINALLRSPDMTRHLRPLISYLNLDSSVPKRLNELAILIQAKHWRQDYEWWAHYELAIKAGLARDVADQIKSGRRPDIMQPDEAAVYDFCMELSQQHVVGDQTFDALKQHLNDQQIVDLIVVSGVYATLAMLLNVAEVAAPENAPTPSPGVKLN
jgi:4-carboxymuconolactone decarboxylase